MPPVISPASLSPLRGLQALRAVAALAVVLYHAGELLRTRLGEAGPGWLGNGAAGVDVFFVVSGFVMMVSSRKLIGRADAARLFLAARLRRIVPLYWLVSGAKLGLAAGLPALVQGRGFSLATIAASFLFLPLHDAQGQFKPVLPVGWTLSFEMLFYGLFALALWGRRPPALFVPPILLAIALLPHTDYAIGELSNKMLLEFGFGIGLAAIWLRGYRLPARIAAPLLCLGLAGLWLMPETLLATRFLSWGLPACLLVGSAVSLEHALAPRLPRAMLALGDASYAIYLTHGFVLAGLAAALRAGPAVCRGTAVVLPLALAGSAAFGWMVHVQVERRLLKAWGSGRPRVVLVLAGGGLTHVSGGVGTLIRNLIEAWSDTGAPPPVRIVDTRGDGGAPAAALCFLRSLLLVLGLSAAGRVQLVHAHMTTRGSAVRKALLCAAARLFGVPVILHMHGADFEDFHRKLHPVWRALLNAAIRQAGRIIVLGRSSRDFLVRSVHVRPAAIDIVPNGVPRRRSAARAAGEPAHILFLGRLCARKGVPELIAALADPALRDRDWRATLAGDGDPAPFQAMLGWYGLDGKVTLPGWADAARTEQLLAEADILVLPSHHEAMPIAVLEALAARVAVIATPVGVIPEFLQNEVNALLVPPGVAEELAAAIVRLLDDPSLRQKLVRAGAAVFDEQLDIRRAAARIAELYRETTARPAAPAVEIEHAR
jgi:peptidoglycan/LPS O-acetylase OafA/YrhL/glycosyltransferase involved in cell wall biosynthesis